MTIQDLVKGIENLMDECCVNDLKSYYYGSIGVLGSENMTAILVEIR
jgi:hypothetical protein